MNEVFSSSNECPTQVCVRNIRKPTMTRRFYVGIYRNKLTYIGEARHTIKVWRVIPREVLVCWKMVRGLFMKCVALTLGQCQFMELRVPGGGTYRPIRFLPTIFQHTNMPVETERQSPDHTTSVMGEVTVRSFEQSKCIKNEMRETGWSPIYYRR